MDPGTRLGPYEILEPLGEGGMGEVYLAEDTRLGRRIAVKVLPGEFASDPERLARFEQEARAAAALNHPHIAVVHDVGFEQGVRQDVDEAAEEDGEERGADFRFEAGRGVHFMVQEYLEGQTLRAALDRDSFSVQRALELGAEIVEGLRAAHAAGIVHRDLKPGNVFLTEDGHSKILDFGLAKLTEVAVAGSPETRASRSPTMLGTAAGRMMGTAGYMAPEQVEGAAEVDHRADLFAFGCLLYEMVGGRRAFSGKSAIQTLNQVVHEEPEPLADLDSRLPAELERIVAKCLAKEPADRYQTAADLVVDLRALDRDVEAGRAAPLSARAAGDDGRRGKRPLRFRASVAAAVVGVVCLLLGLIAGRMLWRSSGGESSPAEFAVDLPGSFSAGVAVSPDGSEIVFPVREEPGAPRLHRRSRDRLEAQPIPGARGLFPFFSPDGRTVGFSTDGRLMTIPVEGGEPFEICRTAGVAIGHWNDDGTIVYSDEEAMYRVAAAGGDPEVLASSDDVAREYERPEGVPGTDAVLFDAEEGEGDSSRIAVLDPETDETRTLVENGADPSWVPTGHVLFARSGDIWAVPFDPGTLQTTGDAFPVRQDVLMRGRNASFGVSRDGTLAYVPAMGDQVAEERLVWVDREGNPEPASVTFDDEIQFPRLSPDGRTVALAKGNEPGEDGGLFTYEVDREISSLLVADAFNPAWSPDGRWIYFSSARSGSLDIHRRPADRSGPAEPVVERPGPQLPAAVSPDGETLLFVEDHPETGHDVWTVATDGGGPQPLLTGSHHEDMPVFSPDGRWIAYRSNLSGRNEIYLRPFPDPGPVVQISRDGGDMPVFSPSGEEVFYATDPGDLWVVRLSGEDPVRPTAPERLLQAVIPEPETGATYDVAASGQRFLMAHPAVERTEQSGGRTADRVVVVLSWFDELMRTSQESG